MDQQYYLLHRSMMGTAIVQMAVMNQASSCLEMHIYDASGDRRQAHAWLQAHLPAPLGASFVATGATRPSC